MLSQTSKIKSSGVQINMQLAGLIASLLSSVNIMSFFSPPNIFFTLFRVSSVRAEMDNATTDHATIGLNKPQDGTISASLADRLSSANLSARTSPATTTETHFNL